MTFPTDSSLLSLFLPTGILDHFMIVDYQTKSTNNELYTKSLTIFLEEKMIVPEEYKEYKINASGFMDPSQVDDYPIRDMLVKLSIKRRRWDVYIEGKKRKVSRDWNLIIEGTRMSKDYSSFLKEISRF